MRLSVNPSPSAPGGANGRRSFQYDLYGLTIRSEVPLPFGPSPVDGGDRADVVIRVAAPSARRPRLADDPDVALRCGHGTIVAARYEHDRVTWLDYPAAGAFAISPDGARVRAYPARAADTSLFRLVLACQVLTFVLYRRATPSLHASAVATERGAIVFLGPKGRGKSTMAATFLRRGASLLTDDALPLRHDPAGVHGIPSLPMMKVWRDTAERALELTEHLEPVAKNAEKLLLVLGDRYELARGPAPIRAIYVLQRISAGTRPAAGVTAIESRAIESRAIESRRVTGHDGIAHLFAQTSMVGLLFPAEMARLMHLYGQMVAQAPVRLLRYPDGFEHQDAVHAAIMADLGQR